MSGVARPTGGLRWATPHDRACALAGPARRVTTPEPADEMRVGQPALPPPATPVVEAKVGTDEWALAPFFNSTGTGFMHQPAILHRVAGAWRVVTDDPAPGEYDRHGIPAALVKHWNITDGMPPADSVTNDAFPEA